MFSWLKKYFFPHKHNDYKPHLLRRESTIIILFSIIVIELFFLVQVFVVFDKTNFLASVLPGVLTTLTNEERAQNNAEPLIENDLLTKAAKLKAEDMASRGYFAHNSPDGKTPWYWLDQVGYKYSMAGENLAVNFFESRDVAEAWMDSPSHRANIVKKNYKEIGIGVATGTFEGRNTVFVAQFFGTPMVKQNTTVATVKNTKPTTTKNTVSTTKKPALSVKATTSVKPTTVKVLGEEIDSPVVTYKDISLYTYLKSWVDKILTSPSKYVNFIYSGIAMIIILVLLLAIFIKREIGHPIIIVRGFAVVAILLIFSFINMKIFHVNTVIPQESLEASVIAY